MFNRGQRRFVEQAPVARFASVDPSGAPHVLPICFVLLDDRLVTPLDEKPKQVEPRRLQRVVNIESNPDVCAVIDHYSNDWSELGWVQLRGRARLRDPDDRDHTRAVGRLREKYPPYREQDLPRRPCIWVEVREVRSWGALEPPPWEGC